MANPEDEKSIADILNESYDKVEQGEKPGPQDETLEFEKADTDLPDPEAADDDTPNEDDDSVEGKTDDEPEDVPEDDPDGDVEESAADGQPEEEPAPSSWKREVAQKWQDLPSEVKNEINRRESDYHKGIEQYKQYAGIGRDIERVIAPHMETIQKLGVHPMEAVGALLNADRQLRTGTPEQKAQLLGQLAQEYGIDLKQVQPLPPVDPAVMQLRQQNQQLQRFQQSVIEQQNSQAMSEIERFSKDPANVHFESVKDDMGLLLQSGKADNLQDAYDKAVWMRPDIRKSLVEQQRTEAEKRAAQAARKNRAKSASVGIKGSSASKGGTLKPDASLRDTLKAVMNGDL